MFLLYYSNRSGMVATRSRGRAAAKGKVTNGQQRKLQETSNIGALRLISVLKKGGGGEEHKEEKEPPQGVPSRKRRVPSGFAEPKARRAKVVPFEKRYGNHHFGLAYNMFPNMPPPPKLTTGVGTIPSKVVPVKPLIPLSSSRMKPPLTPKPEPKSTSKPVPKPVPSPSPKIPKKRSVTKFTNEKPALPVVREWKGNVCSV